MQKCVFVLGRLFVSFHFFEWTPHMHNTRRVEWKKMENKDFIRMAFA